MIDMRMISHGAEAKIYRTDAEIIKERESKDYRHPEIDNRLRKSRTRREAKVLQTLKDAGFPCPSLIEMDDSKMHLKMELIKGKVLRDVLNTDHRKFGREIGEKIAFMHSKDVIHGDLTTSNMILDGEIYFIDFGLSFFSKKIEDKAVDLHLLRQSLESKHYEVNKECFDEVLEGYKKKYKDHKKVISRFREVELRGRNKAK